MPRGRRSADALFVALAAAGLIGAVAPAVRADHAAPAAQAHASTGSGRSARPKTAEDPPDDRGFLEFLGGIGSEDPGWIEYLAHHDPARAPGRKGARASDDRTGPKAGRSPGE